MTGRTFPRKHRSSTNRSNAPPIDGPAEVLEERIRVVQEANSALEASRAALDEVERLLGEPVQLESLQDHFRRLHGFQALLSFAAKAVANHDDQGLASSSIRAITDNLGISIAILTLALERHDGNKRYFARRVDRGGWTVLRATVRTFLSSVASSSQDGKYAAECLVASLLALATSDPTVRETVKNELSALATDGTTGRSPADSKSPLLGSTIMNPDALTILVELIFEWYGSGDLPPDSSALPIFVVSLVHDLAASSLWNANMLSTSCMVRTLLNMRVALARIEDQKIVQKTNLLLAELLRRNCGALTDVQRFIGTACADSNSRQVMAQALRGPHEYPSIIFDLSNEGYSSLEFPSLPRVFPPPTGYTLEFWTKFNKFDDDSHTTIFGAFDVTQTCFVLAYLEKDSRQLILQTSISLPQPSVRFKRIQFQLDLWYHICVVHRPPKAGHYGEALLFVNGRYLERKEKCLYPQTPPPQDRGQSTAPFPPQSDYARMPVQAFFGTPQDLAVQNSTSRPTCTWSISSAHLYDCCLNGDLIAVHHALGPGYTGNFQDRVGQLLTYDASAALNRYNEEVYGEKSDKSSIVSTIQRRGIDALHEGTNLLSASAASSVGIDGFLSGSLPLGPRLNDNASKELQHATKGGNSVIFNTGRPSVTDALSKQSGFGILTGRAFVSLPSRLDDALWRLSGFVGVHIMLLESAESPSELQLSLRALFDSIGNNFRSSEAMEKEHGYSLIALMLREKLGLVQPSASGQRQTKLLQFASVEDRDRVLVDLLNTILPFVGINSVKPYKSLLTNPMAYRSFLTDFDTWRTGSAQAQQLFYRQFVWLLDGNRNLDFNTRRLVKMRIVKKLLDCVRSDRIHRDNLPDVLEALRVLYEHAAGKMDHRDIATFVGFCLEEGRAPPSTPLHRKPTIRMDMSSGRIGTPPLGDRARTNRYDTFGSDVTVPKEELGTAVLEMYSKLLCAPHNTVVLRRFYRHVPVSWLLHILGEPQTPRVVATLQIICHSIATIGSEFLTRLSSKNAGITLVKERIRQHWKDTRIWLLCLSTAFGLGDNTYQLPAEVASADLERLLPPEAINVRFPEVVPWVIGLLEAAITAADFVNRSEDESSNRNILAFVHYLRAVYGKSDSFRDYAESSNYLTDLLKLLYPLVASTERMSAGAEIEQKIARPISKARDAVVKPQVQSLSGRPTILRSGSSRTLPERSHVRRISTPRRPSSFVLIDANDSSEIHLSAHFNSAMAPDSRSPVPVAYEGDILSVLAAAVEDILIGQVCFKKDFSGFGLFLKVPPGDALHQAYFESYILLRTMSSLMRRLMSDESLLRSPRTLMNLARYSLHMAEAVFEGWFIDGARPLVDFTGKILDFVQQPHIAALKDVRLCSQATSTIRMVFLRIVLLRLSELDETRSDTDTLKFLQQLTYWQTILFAPENQEAAFIRLVCYVLYVKLMSNSPAVRLASASLFRMLLVQKPTEAATILANNVDQNHKHLSTGFMKLATNDDEEILSWIDQNRDLLDKLFLDSLSKFWEEFVDAENQKTEESAKNRLAKRIDKLKQWQADELAQEEVLQQAERALGHWRTNSHAQDRIKLHRSIQDQQENITHLYSTIARQKEIMRQPCGINADPKRSKWQLDQTESRDRMRMRLILDPGRDTQMYQPKRKASGLASPHFANMQRSASGTSIGSVDQTINRNDSAKHAPSPRSEGTGTRPEQPTGEISTSLLEGDFEIIDDPKDNDEAFEDKNRKIMRSVERGDSIKSVYNVSRIVGLEACEGLLIIGKKWLYMRDNMFQRSDGELVSMVNAPWEERDHYVHMISGKEIRASRTSLLGSRGDMARSWSWKEVLSMSKRRFLFRDVAVEVFFNDGRSYLLIFSKPEIRNAVYNDISNQAPHIIGPTSSISDEDQWRLDCLRSPEETPQTLSNKFTNVFNNASTNSATKRWVRGDISNFHYLMLVNTMAGRTFNDLTQYPVFPWVLADYSSEELDLTDPRSFRDLGKPMGCQHPAREADYRERYQSFADMGEENPFHYGTHYSSAMIVSSYLIRLQPFVQSYMLLQGGTFDHADRLFDSIERTWISASKQNMTDVRELTPEFYYLPEFLTNMNAYDFGVKEGTGQTINNVHLPPWAKGDPHLFIRKHREALESPHVSEHLHEWVDLIFGYKQKGEAAIDATNVFHPLSYHGAKDLDAIDDPVERLATIGIIHNFGQTPHQVFTKPHQRREAERFATSRLDTQVDTLTRLPKPVAEISSQVASVLPLSSNRILSVGPCKLYAPPDGRFFATYLYADFSLRFHDTETRKLLGIFEALHVGPISTALFLDARTLITGGADSVLGIFDLHRPNSDVLDLRPRTYLHGHRAALTHLAAARAASVLVSADADGRVIVWDLNRYDCVHLLRGPGPALSCLTVSDLTGHILVCVDALVTLYTVNGHKLLEQTLCDPAVADDVISAAAFYDGSGRGEWVQQTVLVTGHRRGVVKAWHLTNLADGAWYWGLAREMSTGEQGREGGAVTSVVVRERGIWAGGEDGKVWQFECVVRSGRR